MTVGRQAGALARLTLAVSFCLASTLGRHAESSETPRTVAGGRPDVGRRLVQAHGCAACHVIPGIPGPFGKVGPALGGIGQRAYIAGSLPNAPHQMVAWLLDPPRLVPSTAMPAMGLSAREAADVASFLYSLPD